MILLSHVLLAATGEGGASPGEAVPQFVVGGLVDTGEMTPLLEQVAELADATAPVGASSDGFRLGDHVLLGLLCAGLGLGPLLPTGLRLGVDGGAESLHPSCERFQVADGMGLTDGRDEFACGRSGFLRRGGPGAHS